MRVRKTTKYAFRYQAFMMITIIQTKRSHRLLEKGERLQRVANNYDWKRMHEFTKLTKKLQAEKGAW